jgi:hypothetical protein
MESQIRAIGTSNTNLQNGITNTSAIGTSNTNWYLKYQRVLQIPIDTSNTNWYFKYQLVLQIPIGTSNTNWYKNNKNNILDK